MPKKLFVIGVGPGSPRYLTDAAKDAISKSRYVIGYKYTLIIIESVIDRSKQQVSEITMENQEMIYNDIYNKMADNDYCTVTFTGDVNFSESEVVDRLLEIFGDDNVEIIPGISSIQIAAARCKVPLDKAHVVTFHVSGDIEEKKLELVNVVANGKSVILLPRPWPRDPKKNFMQSDIAIFLRKNGVDTSNLMVYVFEHLTQDDKETVFKGKVSNLEGKYFDPFSVMVIDQVKRKTYLQFA
ncbi:MAG TPA: precorrin-6y C5,15-methyltransferase (decarboxylating) subunit CbiE [Candidatus Nitrosopolaris rasttigaisensis]|nr:precorrin-6y C5,15-methyltransferase (decarboxylating) subunit CbiE [Candidatus Nitrosopolaris rasttigaisensis]